MVVPLLPDADGDADPGDDDPDDADDDEEEEDYIESGCSTAVAT